MRLTESNKDYISLKWLNQAINFVFKTPIMEDIVNFLYLSLPVLHILLIVGLILKIILMTGFRNFDFPYLLSSYFRFYDKDDNNASNAKRRMYVTVNNYINYYTYLWVLVCIVCLLAFGSVK